MVDSNIEIMREKIKFLCYCTIRSKNTPKKKNGKKR